MSSEARGTRASVAIAFDAMAIEVPAECEVGAGEADAVAAVGAAIEDVERALAALGHHPRRLPLSPDPVTLERALAGLEADVIFNLAESYGGQAAREAEIATRLAATGVPLTGSPPTALATCLDKHRARTALGGAVPVPEAALLMRADDALPPLPWPCILKPAAQDASHGIAFESVCADPATARARAAYLFERGLGPVLVEQYIDGRELNVSVLEAADGALVVLPPAEIAFEAWPEGAPRILTYAAKWSPESLEYQRSVSRRAALPEPDAEAIARKVFTELGMRGYGRVDLRVDPARGPLVIDVNPNPDLSVGAGFQLAAERAGRSYAAVVDAIVQSALRSGDAAARAPR